MKRKKSLFLLGMAAVFIVILVKQQITIAKLNKQYKQYNEQMSKLKYVNSQLYEELDQTKRIDYIEKMAREKLGLVKPGEILFKDRNNAK
jgi:cell division protein FtsB